MKMTTSGIQTNRDSINEHISRLLPTGEIVYAFAYGSGVFVQQEQRGNDMNNKDHQPPPLVDVIVVVKDTRTFHAQNLHRNPSQYPIHNLSYIEWLQSFGPKCYFIIDNGWKIGIVQLDHLLDDLQHWKYLYLAGRLHKPTLSLLSLLSDDSNVTTNALLEQNWHAALAASLLLLPNDEAATTVQVYSQIAALSYAGDFRMGFAEDPNKITKLVRSEGQLERFEAMYRPSVERLQEKGVLVRQGDSWKWDREEPALRSDLPSRLVKSNLSIQLPRIVAPAARTQSFKGLFTVNPSVSFQYALRKLKKGILKR